MMNGTSATSSSPPATCHAMENSNQDDPHGYLCNRPSPVARRPSPEAEAQPASSSGMGGYERAVEEPGDGTGDESADDCEQERSDGQTEVLPKSPVQHEWDYSSFLPSHAQQRLVLIVAPGSNNRAWF